MLLPSIGYGDPLDIFGHCRGYVVIPAYFFLEIEQQKAPTLSEADGVFIDNGQVGAASGESVGGVAKMGVGYQSAAPEGEQGDGIAHVVGADGVVLGNREQGEVGTPGKVGLGFQGRGLGEIVEGFHGLVSVGGRAESEQSADGGNHHAQGVRKGRCPDDRSIRRHGGFPLAAAPDITGTAERNCSETSCESA